MSPAAAVPSRDDLDAAFDAVVIGAGIVGSCCALALADAGLSVCVVDRAGPAGGTSGSGEGNLLVSDKLPGPELDLARRSIELWHDLAGRLGDEFEFEPKGGLVVAETGEDLDGLRALATTQSAAGITVNEVDASGLHDLEPLLSPSLAGGVHYPEDAQLQPMLATTAVLAEARRAGADVRCYTAVLRARRQRGAHVLDTERCRIAAPLVIVASGPWSAEVGRLFGASLPVVPRRGHVLVTEPLAPSVRHKVYAADYVATVSSDATAAECSAVVESTPSGTVLLGSSRELVGFDRRSAPDVVAEIARRAVRLFPFLERVRAIRCYVGFRPATPDHLPVIGPDPAVEGLLYATGHEGAGVGLAPATAELLVALLTGARTPVEPKPFLAERFSAEA